MGISFRFGYKDWFDFSFRIGPRKPIQKTVTKEVFLPSKYHVRCHGPRGRLIEMKTDTMEPMLGMKVQEDCPLFKILPPEIRHMIWALLLVSPDTIESPNRLLASKTPLLTNDYHPIPGIDAVILRTCREIYNETLLVLYGRNTFFFTSSHSLSEFAGDDLPKALPTGDACFLTGNVFNFQVSQAGRFSLVRQLVLKLTSMDTSRNNWNIPSIPARPARPPHRSTLLYDWGRLLCLDGRLPGMYADIVVFPALENLTLDFTDWALAQDEGLMTKAFVKKFSESGLLDKLTIKGIQHQQTLDELRAGLVKPNGNFLTE